MTEKEETTKPEEDVLKKYNFDSEFEKTLVLLALRDEKFMKRASTLLFPKAFSTTALATCCKLAKDHFDKYKETLPGSYCSTAVKNAIDKKIITRDEAREAIPLLKAFFKAPSTPAREPFIDEIVEFARTSAVSNALYGAVDLVEKRDWDKISQKIKEAVAIGADEDFFCYDYFEEIGNRTEIRKDKLAGLTPERGVTTGVLQLDNELYHKGWGRRELSLLMGAAKAGKSLALINFAKSACLKGFDVLYVTLEVSAEIISARLDACLTDTEMTSLVEEQGKVQTRVNALQKKAGKLHIREYPSGSLKPSTLKRYLENAKERGINYDLICVDYADLMAPEVRSSNAIENFRTIYVDLRAIAYEYDCALLTATQTNRAGAQAKVAEMEHVAEDFNKIRTADIVISINSTKEERTDGVVRLYFVACRNQRSGFTLKFRQNMSKMIFISEFLGLDEELVPSITKTMGTKTSSSVPV